MQTNFKKRSNRASVSPFNDIERVSSSSSASSLNPQRKSTFLPGSISHETELKSTKRPRIRMLPAAQTRDNKKLEPLDHYLVRASTQMISFGEINSEDLTVTIPLYTKIPPIRLIEIEVDLKTAKENDYVSVRNYNT